MLINFHELRKVLRQKNYEHGRFSLRTHTHLTDEERKSIKPIVGVVIGFEQQKIFSFCYADFIALKIVVPAFTSHHRHDWPLKLH